MNSIHRRIFMLVLMEQDGVPLSSAERADLKIHLSTCQACQADQMLSRALRARSPWSTVSIPPLSTGAVLQAAGRQMRLSGFNRSLQVAALAVLAVLALFLVQWAFTRLIPTPAGLPVSSPTPTHFATPQVEAGFPAEEPYSSAIIGDGLWSPGGETYFVTFLQPAGSPGSDRRVTVLHFIDARTGQDCAAERTFLGSQGFQNAAWLDDNRLLYLTRTGQAMIFSPCDPEVQEVSELFSEPLIQVMVPRLPAGTAPPRVLLLISAGAYWLFDPASLEARRVEGITPSTSGAGSDSGEIPIQPFALQDSFVLHPSGQQIAILQPIPADPDHSHLSLLDLESGQVLRNLTVAAGAEDRAPLLEWMGPDQMMVWPFESGGPLLVDLAADPPSQIRVITELLGLDLSYPEQIYSTGAFYDPSSRSLHFVVHMNLPADQDVYLYHGENGQIERLPGNQPRLMLFPDGQLMPLVPLQSQPPEQDTFELFWVDRPDQAPVHLVVSGHLPRSYPSLQIQPIPGEEALLIGSSNGISRVSLPDGEVQDFWPLDSGEAGSPPSISVSPDGRAMIVTLLQGQTSDFQVPGQSLLWIELDQQDR